MIDDYIWLDGKAISMVSGFMSAGGVHWPDHSNSAPVCSNAPGKDHMCGAMMVINDHLPKPVMMMSKITGQVTEAALYDAFGHVNRIPMVQQVGGTPVDGQVLGRVQMPDGAQKTRAFWRIMLDVGGQYPAGVPESQVYSNWGQWSPTSSAAIEMATVDNFNQSKGDIQIESVEYQRFSGASERFTNIRFPGQYFDEETDLVENWNRYYDPSSGRYLSPEPLLASPDYQLFMAHEGRAVPAYAYAENNPIRNIDPDGLMSKSEGVPGDDIAYKELKEAMDKGRKAVVEVGEKWLKKNAAKELKPQRWRKIKGWIKLAKDGRLPTIVLGICWSTVDCACIRDPDRCSEIFGEEPEPESACE